MLNPRGFSLIEVLISLVLTSTISFFLLDLYNSGFTFFNQSMIHSNASARLDEIDELLITDEVFFQDKFFGLSITQTEIHTQLVLYDKNNSHLLTRTYQTIKVAGE